MESVGHLNSTPGPDDGSQGDAQLLADHPDLAKALSNLNGALTQQNGAGGFEKSKDVVAASLQADPHDALFKIACPDYFLGARGIIVNAVVYQLKKHLVQKVRDDANFLRWCLLETYPTVGQTVIDHCELRSDPTIRALVNRPPASEEELAKLITVARTGTRDGKGKALAAENPIRYVGSERYFDPRARDKILKRARGNTMVFPHFTALKWLEEYTKGEIKVEMSAHVLMLGFAFGKAMINDLGCTSMRPPSVLNSATGQPDPLPNYSSSGVKFLQRCLTGFVRNNTAASALSIIQAQAGGKRQKLATGGSAKKAIVLDDSDSGDDVPLSERGAKKKKKCEDKEASGEASGKFEGSAFDEDAF